MVGIVSKRKLQKIKGGSYIVSLPSEWVKKVGLEQGSELLMYETWDGLGIALPRERSDTLEITYEDLETTKYMISVMYMQGARRIRVKGNGQIPSEAKRELRNLQLSHIGLTVTEEDFSSITFSVRENSVISPVELFEEFVGRVLIVLRDFISVSGRGFHEMRKDIMERCNDLNKFYRLIIRYIALMSYGGALSDPSLTTKDLILYAVATRDLGRFIYHMQALASMDVDLSGRIERIYEMFVAAVEVFRSGSVNKVPLIRKLMRELEQSLGNTVDDKELLRMASYAIAIMDDGVHKSVRLC